MSNYDILMLVVLVAAVLFGLVKGLAWQVASIAAIVVSYFVAINFNAMLAPMIGTEEPLNTYLAMFILYLATSLGVWIVFGFVRRFIDKMELKGFDRQAGAILGAVKGGLLCIVITLFAVTLLGENWRRNIIQSRSGFYIARAIDSLSAFVPTQYHDTVAPYINNFNEVMEESKVSGAREYSSEFSIIDPSTLDPNRVTQGAWELEQSPFELNESARNAIESARQTLNSQR